MRQASEREQAALRREVEAARGRESGADESRLRALQERAAAAGAEARRTAAERDEALRRCADLRRQLEVGRAPGAALRRTPPGRRAALICLTAVGWVGLWRDLMPLPATRQAALETEGSLRRRLRVQEAQPERDAGGLLARCVAAEQALGRCRADNEALRRELKGSRAGRMGRQ